MEAGIGVLQQRKAKYPRELGKARNEIFPRRWGVSEGLLTASVWTSGLRNCERVNFCHFRKPLSLWSFVMVATGNKYTKFITTQSQSRTPMGNNDKKKKGRGMVGIRIFHKAIDI